MTEKSKASPILGFSDTETVKLDFDDASFGTVKYWASRTMKRFKLQGFIILRSSQNRHHIVFDRAVSWKQNVRVVAWVTLLSHNKSLAKWFLMQCIKGCSTLRVSSKREKPPPRIVYRHGKQDQNVKDFLRNRQKVKRIIAKMQEKPRFSRVFAIVFDRTYVPKTA